MQKLDIRDIKKALGVHMRVSETERLLLEGVDLVGPVHFDLKLTNAGSRILVEGIVEATARVQCARCVETFDLHEKIDIHEEFLPSGSEELPKGPDLHPEELSVFIYDEDRIDIEEVIRQNIIAALPIQPLCRPDCGGLCTVCGVNRNETPCQCETKTVDPRWKGLEKFIQKP
ncbi:MAG TPA: DUF177 domain-containing protein [Candidatus Xenobia bacterium]|jgi:uncharacterized protein